MAAYKTKSAQCGITPYAAIAQKLYLLLTSNTFRRLFAGLWSEAYFLPSGKHAAYHRRRVGIRDVVNRRYRLCYKEVSHLAHGYRTVVAAEPHSISRVYRGGIDGLCRQQSQLACMPETQ